MHGCFAQLPSHDIVVAAIRNVGRNSIGAIAACSATAISPAARAIAALGSAGAVARTALSLSLCLTFARTVAFALAVTFASSALFRSNIAARSACLPATARPAATIAALTGNDRLLIAHASIENAERGIEFSIDLRSSFAGGHGATTARGTAVAATWRSCCATP